MWDWWKNKRTFFEEGWYGAREVHPKQVVNDRRFRENRETITKQGLEKPGKAALRSSNWEQRRGEIRGNLRDRSPWEHSWIFITMPARFSLRQGFILKRWAMALEKILYFILGVTGLNVRGDWEGGSKNQAMVPFLKGHNSRQEPGTLALQESKEVHFVFVKLVYCLHAGAWNSVERFGLENEFGNR